MNSTKPRDRIWFNMLNAERMYRYYSRRSQQLDARYKRITYGITVIPLVAFALFGLEWQYANWVASALLFVAGLCEVWIIHEGLGGDIKAAKIMANQTTELAQQWRWLWINQKRADTTRWIEMLERQTQAVTMESIPYREDVSAECAKEAKYGLAVQFKG